MNRHLELIVALVLFGAMIATVAEAKVYLDKETALQRAFPDAGEIETRTLYLSPDQQQQIARASGAPVDSAIYTFYVGRKGGQDTGYAAIEAATVRTLPETVMVVLEPDGRVRFVEILAFFEPEEYKPPQRWLEQFPGRTLGPQLRVGGEIQGITGATLSAQAITRQVRKSSAMLQLLLEGGS